MQTSIGFNQLEQGISSYSDNSYWNYKRPTFNRISFAPNIYNCSRMVCDNARKEPLKYVCKYFNIKPTEENLSVWENVLNNYCAAENGKKLLNNKKNAIMFSINNDIPFLIKKLSKEKLMKNLGFTPINLNTIYFPRYIFNYVSSGGYASTQCVVTMDIENINKLITYLSQIIKFKKSIQGQRALMTSRFRNEILTRDNYTCQMCKLSVRDEPNLLLEVDHIIPLSKGGTTNYNNLQTLCWKCNRSKSNKIIKEENKSDNILKIPYRYCNSLNLDTDNYCNNCGMKQ